MEKRVYVVGGAIRYASFLKDYTLVDKLEEANLVIFTGGEDVTPSFYGIKKHSRTFCNTARDKEEKAIFNKIDPKKQVVVGICRGSQFCCVMNGGKLVQHCTGHGLATTHEIYNPKTEMVYQITSTHHQMQYPFNLKKDEDYELLYVSQPRSNCYEGLGEYSYDPILSYGEPEVVLYHTKENPVCLAIQGHPEIMPVDSPVCEMLRNQIDSLL